MHFRWSLSENEKAVQVAFRVLAYHPDAQGATSEGKTTETGRMNIILWQSLPLNLLI
jgi:hypothetical protein